MQNTFVAIVILIQWNGEGNMKVSKNKKVNKKIILTIIEREIEFKSVSQMMKRKEQLFKMGVLSRARITSG
tara:strand:- start:66 stop:278 length:213 start_codon:yes stop_codon:yes gene_type:complete